MIKGKVSIILTTFLPKSKRYLDLAIRSIENLDYPKELIEVILVGKKSYQPHYVDRPFNIRTVAPDTDEFYNAFGLNYGFTHADPESQYLFIMNDDACFTRDSLRLMVECAGDHKVFVQPLSPCDNHRLYSLAMGYMKNGTLKQLNDRHYVYEQLENDIPEMLNAQSFYPPGILRNEFHCMFATLIPMQAYRDIGPWDDKFKTGQDDLDYSLRGSQKGYQCITALNALIWHFGGVSVNTGTLTPELRKSNLAYFKEKWGGYPPGVTQEMVDGIT